jgi:phosphatidylglycerophosphate synthase
MTKPSIVKAVLIALNTDLQKVSYDSVYGGETLLNRALIAMSKSGIRFVVIICREGYRGKIQNLTQSIYEKRLALDYEIQELNADEKLSDKLCHVTESWDDAFLIFETDKIMHPSFLNQAVTFSSSQTPLLFCYKNVWQEDGHACFDPSVADKFKTIFEMGNVFTKVDLMKDVFQAPVLEPKRALNISHDLKSGIYSTDVAVCRRHDLSDGSFRTFPEMIGRWNEERCLTIGFVENAWWLKVSGKESKQQITNFFWKIAFKEISGEFSKLVNSRFSKPMTFFFVRLGFSPNAISIIQMILFIVSASFLLIPEYWAMIVFAVIWQFSAGVLDRCDGETARVRNYESESGGRFDMLIDDLRFGLPFAVVTIACYREYQFDRTYLITGILTFMYSSTATFFHNRFLKREGYVSIQAMGKDFLKTQDSGIIKLFKKVQPFVKGDIRTFYVFVAAFFGNKDLVFWMLAAYAWLLGITYFFAIRNFRSSAVKT